MRQIAKLSSLSVISVLLILVACGTSNNNVGTVPDDGGSGGISALKQRHIYRNQRVAGLRVE